jgi:murein DD-endopeptidase MepM/ murein hydrolase activator NlpD
LPKLLITLTFFGVNFCRISRKILNLCNIQKMNRLANIPTVALLAFLFVCTSAMAGIPDEKDKPGDDKKAKAKRDDTTRYVISEESLDETPDTTALLFPSNDLYASWDTEIIHHNNFAECFIGDSMTIKLTETGDGGFSMPKKGDISSVFGWRRRRPHYGTDVKLDIGDTVVSAFDGMVRIAKTKQGGYGNVVVVRHNNGLETVYAHLSKILVEPGQQLKSGELLGYGGNTGRSTGPHLHFEIRYLGQALDAEDFIDFTTGQLKKDEFVLHKTDVDNKYDLRALHNRHRHDAGMRHYEGKNTVTYSKGSKIYKVRNGDNLGVIAKRNHTTVSAICKKNHFKTTHVLRIGEKLKL